MFDLIIILETIFLKKSYFKHCSLDQTTCIIVGIAHLLISSLVTVNSLPPLPPLNPLTPLLLPFASFLRPCADYPVKTVFSYRNRPLGIWLIWCRLGIHSFSF